MSPGVLAVGNGTLSDYTGTLIAGTIGIATTSPQAKLDVNGGARVGADATCNGSKAGTLAWNTSTLQVCNGTSWSSLGAGGGSASGTAGYVQISGGSGAFTSDSTAGGQFFWDSTNHRLGIGTTSPTELLTTSKSDFEPVYFEQHVGSVAVDTRGGRGGENLQPIEHVV